MNTACKICIAVDIVHNYTLTFQAELYALMMMVSHDARLAFTISLSNQKVAVLVLQKMMFYREFQYVNYVCHW